MNEKKSVFIGIFLICLALMVYLQIEYSTSLKLIQSYSTYKGYSKGVVYKITPRTGNSRFYHVKYKTRAGIFTIKNNETMLANLGDSVAVSYIISNPKIAVINNYNEKDGIIDGIVNLIIIDSLVMIVSSILFVYSTLKPDSFQNFLKFF